MQNKENGFGRFVKEKGYYIVLLLCAVAIGVSGYLLLSGKNSDQQVHLSTERATVPPGVRATEHAENVVATDGPEPGTEATEPTLRLQPPVAGEQTGGFAADHLAYNATTRDWRTHEGLDLAAALGDPVCAAADGTVYTIYEDERYGTTVVLRHSGGFTTHMPTLSDGGCRRGRYGPRRAAPRHGRPDGSDGDRRRAACAFALYNGNTPEDPAEYWQ